MTLTKHTIFQTLLAAAAALAWYLTRDNAAAPFLLIAVGVAFGFMMAAFVDRSYS